MPEWIHPGIRAVFFDAVGTLLFPEPSALAVYADLVRRSGHDVSEAEIRERFVAAYRAQEEADRAAGWATSEERERERWHRIVTTTLRGVPDPDACFRELFDHFSRPTAWRLAPGAENVIGALTRRGLTLGLGTNYDARVWPVLDGFPALDPLRPRVVVSAAVGFRKPATGFFREVIRTAGCGPHEMLFVGDDIDNDYEGASAAGLDAVLFDRQDRVPLVRNRINRLTELIDPPG
ncbi:MAG: dUMP phosphatase [Gemmataceae bacterium]|nr:dUMP phosphatase [Gemmataceae bacterium]